MNIVCVKETNETRVALVPDSVKKLCRIEGIEVIVEKGISDIFSDQDYLAAGAEVMNRELCLETADILISYSLLEEQDLKHLKPKTLSISFLDVYRNPKKISVLKEYQLSSVSLEMIPRTTIAQKMDAVSSQASLAGYAAVVIGSNYMNKIFPMMMTPSGTIKPAKVFVIGAGVAGLQAIATAKRLGAKVTAFDTRPVVKEQVESLGATFLEIDLGETGQTKDGYAKSLTEEQLLIQQQEMTKALEDSDLVITTAKLFGRKAPIIIKKDMLENMKQGSVIVDIAASTGGNVDGTKKDKITKYKGVTLVGYDLPKIVYKDASIMFSNNIVNFVSHFWNKEDNSFDYDKDNMLDDCLVTKEGVLVNKRIIDFIGG